jgi:hypothetical protein
MEMNTIILIALIAMFMAALTLCTTLVHALAFNSNDLDM